MYVHQNYHAIAMNTESQGTHILLD